MRPISFPQLAIPALSTTSVALAQPVGAGNSFVLNGTLQTGGVFPVGFAVFLTFTSSGNDTGVNVTISGYNRASGGGPISEVLALTNGGTATSVNAYSLASLQSITVSASTSFVSVGNLQSGTSIPVPTDLYVPNQVTTISVSVTGTLNYTVQYTNEDPYSATFMNGIAPQWVSHPDGNLVGANSSQTGSTTTLMRVVRLLVNSGSGSSVFTLTQQSSA